MPGSSISHVNTYHMSEGPEGKIAALEAERDKLKKALREVTECFIEASIELRGVYRELSRSQAAKDGVEP